MCCVCSAAFRQGSSAGRKPLGQVFGQWCQRRVRCVENQQCVSIQQHELHLCPVRTAAGQPQDQVRRPLLKSGSLSNLCVTVQSGNSPQPGLQTGVLWGHVHTATFWEWQPQLFAGVNSSCFGISWLQTRNMEVNSLACLVFWTKLLSETSIILVLFITY